MHTALDVVALTIHSEESGSLAQHRGRSSEFRLSTAAASFNATPVHGRTHCSAVEVEEDGRLTISFPLMQPSASGQPRRCDVKRKPLR